MMSVSVPSPTRRAEDGQGHEVGRDHDEGAVVVRVVGEGAVVADVALGGRVLQQHACNDPRCSDESRR